MHISRRTFGVGGGFLYSHSLYENTYIFSFHTYLSKNIFPFSLVSSSSCNRLSGRPLFLFSWMRSRLPRTIVSERPAAVRPPLDLLLSLSSPESATSPPERS